MNLDLERNEILRILDAIEEKKRKLRWQIKQSEMRGSENNRARESRDKKEFALGRLALLYNKLENGCLPRHEAGDI